MKPISLDTAKESLLSTLMGDSVMVRRKTDGSLERIQRPEDNGIAAEGMKIAKECRSAGIAVVCSARATS